MILKEDQNELRLSVEELSKCLLKIVTDDCWAREVGKLNRCRYKDAFSLEKMRMALSLFIVKNKLSVFDFSFLNTIMW